MKTFFPINMFYILLQVCLSVWYFLGKLANISETFNMMIRMNRSKTGPNKRLYFCYGLLFGLMLIFIETLLIKAIIFFSNKHESFITQPLLSFIAEYLSYDMLFIVAFYLLGLYFLYCMNWVILQAFPKYCIEIRFYSRVLSFLQASNLSKSFGLLSSQKRNNLRKKLEKVSRKVTFMNPWFNRKDKTDFLMIVYSVEIMFMATVVLLIFIMLSLFLAVCTEVFLRTRRIVWEIVPV